MFKHLSTEARLAYDPFLEERHYSSGAMSNQPVLPQGQAIITAEIEIEHQSQVIR